MKSSFTVAALAAALPLVSAQREAVAYAQCGGRHHTGPKSCVSGFHCHPYNPFYAQCVPGAASNISAIAPSATSSAASNVSIIAPTAYASSVSSCKTQITISRSGNASVQATAASNNTSAPAVYGSVTLTYSVSSAEDTSIAQASTSAEASFVSSASATLQTKAVTSATAASSAVATSVASAASTGSYPSASGTKFVIDGEAGYFAGTNAYWIGFLTNNSDVDLVMQHLKESGLKVLRVWGFNDVTSTPSSGTVYFQSFAGSEPTINTGADGLERLDYVVKSAEAHGIKLIINFVNNWTDYGGMAAYFTYAGITDNTQWYNNTKAQTQYQAYIKAVVSRYPSSSAIFGWELANEPRCTGCDLSIMTTWITNTAKYIKSLDPNRMVTTGEEGFGLTTGDDGTYPYTTGAGGYNFADNCAIADIDFCTYHLYPESWDVTPTQGWGNDWITNHAKACVAAGKPCLLEEFGASDNCTIESSWEATALSATGTGGDMFWQYGDTISSGETSQDGNTVYYGSDLYTCLVTNHIKAIDAAQ